MSYDATLQYANTNVGVTYCFIIRMSDSLNRNPRLHKPIPDHFDICIVWFERFDHFVGRPVLSIVGRVRMADLHKIVMALIEVVLC